MFPYYAYLRLADGEVQPWHVVVNEKTEEGIHAVYFHGFSPKQIAAEFGAGIDITILGISGWMADHRHTEFWCQPSFGVSLDKVPDETQGFLYQKENGVFGVILPVVSEKYKCVLCGKGTEQITAKLFSLYAKLNDCDALAFVWAEGENPYELLEKCTAYALKLLGTKYRTRSERRYPEVFEYLGWCSWDAMEIRVNEEDLLKKCREFREKNIPVKWAIIDDMWAYVEDFYGITYENRPEMFRLMHSSRLYGFEADPVRFPHGLKACVSKMNEYGITVGMWHPTTGYWRGLDPDGETAKKYQDILIQTEDGRVVYAPKKEAAYLYYCAFHDYLRRAGAEFIKIDNQSSMAGCYKGMAPIGIIARDIHDAMEASVGSHFDNQMINCMGMASEDMWNRSISPISRCSDDFLPEDVAWFTKHILQCAYNCLIQGQFYYCDWDMWWTDDGQAVKNSILRAVSGGPIYISDRLERSKRDILMPLILDDGRILRCDRPAMPAKECIVENPQHSGKIFKLQNICGESGILAVFHLDVENRAVYGSISPSDVNGLEDGEFAVYEHFSKECRILSCEEKFEICLKNASEYRLYVIVPVRDGFAVVGRTDKFISPKTIKSVKEKCVELWEDGEYAVVEDGKLKMIRDKL